MSNKYFAAATWVLSILAGIISLLFIFIEGRMLLFGDWLVYDNQILGFFSVLSKFLLAVILLTTSILGIVNIFKKNESINTVLFFVNIPLIAGSILLCIYGANYAGELFLAITLLVFLLRIFDSLVFRVAKKFTF